MKFPIVEINKIIIIIIIIRRRIMEVDETITEVTKQGNWNGSDIYVEWMILVFKNGIYS